MCNVASVVTVVSTIAFDAGVVIFLLNIYCAIDSRSSAWLPTDVPHGVCFNLPFLEYCVECSHCINCNITIPNTTFNATKNSTLRLIHIKRFYNSDYLKSLLVVILL